MSMEWMDYEEYENEKYENEKTEEASELAENSLEEAGCTLGSGEMTEQELLEEQRRQEQLEKLYDERSDLQRKLNAAKDNLEHSEKALEQLESFFPNVSQMTLRRDLLQLEQLRSREHNREQWGIELSVLSLDGAGTEHGRQLVVFKELVKANGLTRFSLKVNGLNDEVLFVGTGNALLKDAEHGQHRIARLRVKRWHK